MAAKGTINDSVDQCQGLQISATTRITTCYTCPYRPLENSTPNKIPAWVIVGVVTVYQYREPWAI